MEDQIKQAQERKARQIKEFQEQKTRDIATHEGRKLSNIIKTSAFNGAVDIIAAKISAGLLKDDKEAREDLGLWREYLYSELSRYVLGYPKFEEGEEKFEGEK